MIVEMEKVQIFGLLSDKDAILQGLMKQKCVHLTSPACLEDYDQFREMVRTSPAELFELEQRLNRYASAIALVSPFAQNKGLFSKKSRLTSEQLQDTLMLQKADILCDEVEHKSKRMADIKAQRSKDSFQLASLLPWSGLDIDLALEQTSSTVVWTLLFPKETDFDQLAQRMREASPFSYLELVSRDEEQLYAVLICHKSSADAAWELAKEMGAAKTGFPGLRGSAGENIGRLKRRIAENDALLENIEESLQEHAGELELLQFGYDALLVRIEHGRAYADMVNTEKAFALCGWAPAPNRPALEEFLQKFACGYEFSACEAGDEPPVLLKNNGFVEPFESITEMYSLPSPFGLDPSGIMAPFFIVFFGMMLSDAGYGILLTLGCFAMLKLMDLGRGAQKMIKALMWGGVSTIIWGAVYGSWFGDIIEAVALTFFGKTVVVPALIKPLDEPMIILGLSCGLGVIHLFVGMGLKAYLLIKRGKAWDAVFDVGFWYMAIVGLLLLIPGGMAAQAGKILAIAGAVGLVLTQGREKKNIFGKISSGILSLYDITGYFSDALSYSRILALGLATGVIASVVNIMGTMFGAGIVGALLLIVIFVLGHLLNFAINGLGAYVHTARLQYVEFFSKFYESGGSRFLPLQAKTKYTVIINREETK